MEEKRSRTLSFEDTPARWWKNIIIPSLPVMACILGGATEKWSEGIILTLLGIILLVDPPRVSLGPALNIIVLVIVACAMTAFLPANWFATPGWKQILMKNFRIPFPATVTAQPFLSLECLISLIAGVSWLYYVCALDLELRDVRQQFRIFSAGIIFLAALSLATLPQIAVGQTPARPFRVGWVVAGSHAAAAAFLEPLRTGFAEHGYVEGRDLGSKSAMATTRPTAFPD